MANIETSLGIKGDLLSAFNATRDDASFAAHAEVYGMRDLLSFHQARLAEPITPSFELPELTFIDSEQAVNAAAGDTVADQNTEDFSVALPVAADATLVPENLDEGFNSDALPIEEPKPSGGFFDVIGAVAQGAWNQLLDPVAMVKNIAIGAGIAVAGVVAVALLPEIVIAVGVGALVGVAVGTVVQAVPELIHDADVVANPGNFTLSEYQASHQDLENLGALTVDSIAQGLGGSYTLAVRPLLAQELLRASGAQTGLALNSSVGNIITSVQKPIRVLYQNEKPVSVLLPDGTRAHDIGDGVFVEYHGPYHPLAGQKKPFSAEYQFFENGDVARITPAEIQLFKPDGSVTTELRASAVLPTEDVSAVTVDSVKRAYLDLPEEIRNLVASNVAVKVGVTVPDAVPSLSGKTFRVADGESAFDGAAGVYVPGQNKIGIAEKANYARAGQAERLLTLPNLDGTFRHEVGHLVDKELDYPHMTDDFVNAFNEDFAETFSKLPKSSQDRFGYFLQREDDGSFGYLAHSETFAEVFAAISKRVDLPEQTIPNWILHPLAKLLFVKPDAVALEGYAAFFPKTVAMMTAWMERYGYKATLSDSTL